MWLIVAAALGSLNWFTYYHLVTRGVRGQATVLELLPRYHNTVSYEYNVAGQNFTAQTQSWPPNPPLEQLAVGQAVVIYYDPVHPDRSVLGDPRLILKNETMSVALAAFILPTFIALVWTVRTSRRKAKQKM